MEKGSQIVSGQHLENMNAEKTTAGVKKKDKLSGKKMEKCCFVPENVVFHQQLSRLRI